MHRPDSHRDRPYDSEITKEFEALFGEESPNTELVQAAFSGEEFSSTRKALFDRLAQEPSFWDSSACLSRSGSID